MKRNLITGDWETKEDYYPRTSRPKKIKQTKQLKNEIQRNTIASNLQSP
jgi:hypothetical protein